MTLSASLVEDEKSDLPHSGIRLLLRLRFPAGISYDGGKGEREMRGGKIWRYLDRQFFADLIVFWFAIWIVWWFRRWFGHGPVDYPDPASAGARAYYTLAMRTLARSLLQSFLIAFVALAAWRIFRYRTPKGDSQHSS